MAPAFLAMGIEDDLEEYSWIFSEESDGEPRLLYLCHSDKVPEGRSWELEELLYTGKLPSESFRVLVPLSWTALALTDHLMLVQQDEASIEDADLFQRQYVINPNKLKGTSGSRVTVYGPRCQLTPYSEATGLISGWDAVTSGKLHLQDMNNPIRFSSTAELDSGDIAIFRLLQALYQMYAHCAAVNVSSLRMLHAVRSARTALEDPTRPLLDAKVWQNSVWRGELQFWLPDGEEEAWMHTLTVLKALCKAAGTDDGTLDEEEDSDVAALSSTKDPHESAAIDLALVLRWADKTGFLSRTYLQASQLLETVWAAGVQITSERAIRVIGEHIELVNKWILESEIKLDDETCFTIDDICKLPRPSHLPKPIPPSMKPPPWPPGRPLPENQQVDRISLLRGVGSPPSKKAVVQFRWRDKKRGRLHAEGGVLVTSRHWRLVECDVRGEVLPLPKLGVGAKMSRQEQEEATLGFVNAVLEGTYGMEMSRWLLTQLRTYKLAVHRETDVSYRRESQLRTRPNAPLVDARLGKKCVKDLLCYTDLCRVYVDFENNGRLRRVRVRSNGTLKVDKDPVDLKRHQLYHCVIRSREMS